jgi:integrase
MVHIRNHTGRERKTVPTKITETVRSARLRRPFTPGITKDSDIPGFALIVTRTRGFWSQFYQPKGINPSTGKRWGGGVRYELGDAMMITVAEARTAALAAKALIRQGRSPHHERLASTAFAVAQRAILPATVAESLDAYAAALMTRRQPSEYTRRKSIGYARKAIRLMKVEPLAVTAIDARMVRLMVETMAGSDAERHLVFRGLNRFLAWTRKQGLVERNVCDELDRDEKPRDGQSRDHVPSLEELRAVWAAVEDEPQRDLVRFLLLVPLRRDEAAGLAWSEVDLQLRRIRIAATRAKTREVHELPLATPALALLEARKPKAQGNLVFPARGDKQFAGFDALLKRIRKRIGISEAAKAKRFVLHDIRRGFVSHLAERGYDVDLLDQCLGHSRRGSFGVYQRASRMAERGRALEAWAGLIAGEGIDQAGKVVPLRATRTA